MRPKILSFFLTVAGRVMAAAIHEEPCEAPTVTLDDATVTGISLGQTNQFLGIPFAQPPTGNRRFRLPQPLPPYDTDFSATTYGPACPQQGKAPPWPVTLPNATLGFLSQLQQIQIYTKAPAEDCLTLNVIAPKSATESSKLPVVVWFYGGGFEDGASEGPSGAVIVEKAISLHVPAIYVSMNYRLNAFGFLASQEVKKAGVGNLGLHDQRQALRWVQQYICAFGGDPEKVTIWGQSAGAVSVGLQMVTNGGNTEGLFRAAFMQSGSPFPVGDITHGQPYYNALVEETGCAAAPDTLQCLREVPYERLFSAMNRSPWMFAYQSIDLAWLPRVDGVFLTADPQYLVQQGSVADIPFVSGDCNDEGTLFSFSTLNITTDAQFEEYIHTYLFPHVNASTLAQLAKKYPSDPAQGSPFNTGHQNAMTPQYKRLAAFQGDYAFQAPRRFFLKHRSGKQRIWAYLSERLKTLPILGSTHASDLISVYNGTDLTAYLVRFVTHLDPNVGERAELYWPQYDATTNQTMLAFLDGSVPQALTTDTYRTDAIAYLTDVVLDNPM